MAPTSQLEKADYLPVSYTGSRLKRDEANVKAQSDAQKPSNGDPDADFNAPFVVL
jgi:hypothetical protein